MDPGTKLPGPAVRRLQEALLSAFPTLKALAQMVRVAMEASLEAVATQGNLGVAAFELIGWAEAQGRLDDLVAAARQENPGNPELRAFEEEWRKQKQGPVAPPPSPTATVPEAPSPAAAADVAMFQATPVPRQVSVPLPPPGPPTWLSIRLHDYFPSELIRRLLRGLALDLANMNPKSRGEDWRIVAYIDDRSLFPPTHGDARRRLRLVGYHNLTDPVLMHGHPHRASGYFADLGPDVKPVKWLPDDDIRTPANGGIWAPVSMDKRAAPDEVKKHWRFPRREGVRFAVRFAERKDEGSPWVVVFVNYCGREPEPDAARRKTAWRPWLPGVVENTLKELHKGAEGILGELSPRSDVLGVLVALQGLPALACSAADDVDRLEEKLKEVLERALTYLVAPFQRRAEKAIFANIRRALIHSESRTNYCALSFAQLNGQRAHPVDHHVLPFRPRDVGKPEFGGGTAWMLTYFGDEARCLLGQSLLDHSADGEPKPADALDMWKDLVFCSSLGGAHTGSQVVLPIQAEGCLWGALNLESPVPDTFLPVDMPVLQACAETIGLIVERHVESVHRMRARKIHAGTIGAGTQASEVRPLHELGEFLSKELDPDCYTIAPWDRSFWPLLCAEIGTRRKDRTFVLEAQGSGATYEARPQGDDGRAGLTCWIHDNVEAREGVWVASDGASFACSDVTRFSLDTLDKYGRPKALGPPMESNLGNVIHDRNDSSRYALNDKDISEKYRTLIGVPIVVPLAHSDAGPASPVCAAVVWVKYKAQRPYDALLVRELVTMLRHAVVRMAGFLDNRSSRAFGIPNVHALSSYLERMKAWPVRKQPCLALYLDGDEYRELTGRSGFIGAQKSLKETLLKAVLLVRDSVESKQRARGRRVYIDVWHVAADVFVITLRSPYDIIEEHERREICIAMDADIHANLRERKLTITFTSTAAPRFAEDIADFADGDKLLLELHQAVRSQKSPSGRGKLGWMSRRS